MSTAGMILTSNDYVSYALYIQCLVYRLLCINYGFILVFFLSNSKGLSARRRKDPGRKGLIRN